MAQPFIRVPVDDQGPPSDIITPATLKYALDLSRADAANAGFVADPVHRDEIAALYNAAVKDGRFVRKLSTDPAAVAGSLGLPLSQGAADSIKKIGSFSGSKLTSFPHGFDPRTAWVTVVCVAIIVCVADTGPDDLIFDRSGVIKL